MFSLLRLVKIAFLCCCIRTIFTGMFYFFVIFKIKSLVAVCSHTSHGYIISSMISFLMLFHISCCHCSILTFVAWVFDFFKFACYVLFKIQRCWCRILTFSTWVYNPFMFAFFLVLKNLYKLGRKVTFSTFQRLLPTFCTLFIFFTFFVVPFSQLSSSSTISSRLIMFIFLMLP